MFVIQIATIPPVHASAQSKGGDKMKEKLSSFTKQLANMVLSPAPTAVV